MLIAMFAGYAESIEPIKIVSDHNNESRISPDLSPREWKAEVDYLNNVTGLDLSPEEISKLLSKMGHDVTPSKTDKNILDVSVPITRADILHQADIMEDYSIAYGFNKLPRVYPNKTAAVSAPLPINKLADIVRLESASAGWTEVMPLILCSHEENFEWLNRVDDGKTAIKLANPKTAEYQLVRTSLLPGLLKTINSNKHHSVPMKIFEVSDVGFKDETQERKSRNERHFAAAIMGKTSGFEQVHGLMDRLMLMLRSKFTTREDGLKNTALEGYWIEEVEGTSRNPTFPLIYQILTAACRQDFPPRPRSVHQDQPGRQEPHHRRLRHPAPQRPAQVRAAVPCQHSRVQPRGLLVEMPICSDVVVLGYRYVKRRNLDEKCHNAYKKALRYET
jgi:phenylalanyl-tRNA synthetase beta chain